MTVSEGFVLFLRLRRIVAIVSVLAGAGTYKFGPTVWHKVEGNQAPQPTATVPATTPNPTIAAVNHDSDSSSKTAAPAAVESDASKGIPPLVQCDCELGAVMLTNHYETCVSLGKGKDCIFTPKMVDSHTIHLTLAVESKNTGGKFHDLSIAEVVAPVGKPIAIAVGGLSFSFTPNMAQE